MNRNDTGARTDIEALAKPTEVTRDRNPSPNEPANFIEMEGVGPSTPYLQGGSARASIVSTMAGLIMLCVLLYVSKADAAAIAAQWTGNDTGSFGAGVVFSQDGTSVKVAFPGQTTPSHYVATVIADAGVTNSPFAGNYTTSGAKGVSFQIMGSGYLPSAARVMLAATGTGRKWYNPNVNVSPVSGVWITNNVSFDRVASGWRLLVQSGKLWTDWTPAMGGDLDGFWQQDLTNVGLIGIQLIQGGLSAQSFTLDQFMLVGANGSPITPPAQLSPFHVRTITREASGTTIQWESVAGATYTVYRSQDLEGQFLLLDDPNSRNMPATETGYMSYTDASATGTGPYFYRVVGD